MKLVPEFTWQQKLMLACMNQGVVLAFVGWSDWLWIFGIQAAGGFSLGVLFALLGTAKFRVSGE